MITMGFDEDENHENILRQHIRELLHDYVSTYLTIDHVQHSEEMVSEILSRILNPLPLHEPGMLALPVDPLDALKSKLKLGTLTPYDEAWEMPDKEVLGFIKKCMTSTGKPSWEDLWYKDDGVNYTRMLHHPMSPAALSRVSLRKTPKLGSSDAFTKITGDTPLAAFLWSRGVKIVEEEILPEPERVKVEDVLDMKLTIDAATHTGMIECQRRTPFFQRPAPPSDAKGFSKRISSILRHCSPPYKLIPQLMSPPLFARNRCAGVSAERKPHLGFQLGLLDTLRGAAKLDQPVKVEEIDPDIADSNMKIINGWTALCSSPSFSTPSLSSAASDVDELENEIWKMSSPSNVPEPIKIMRGAMMDEPAFPRARMPRCGTKLKSDEDEQSLASFMASHRIHVVTTPKSDNNSNDQAHIRPSSPPITLSMIGQPPSEVSCEEHSYSAEINMKSGTPNDELENNTIVTDMNRILKDVKGQRHQDPIANERLDEKDEMFIPVPVLPPPNDYLHRDQARNKLIHDRKASMRSLVKGDDGSSIGTESPVLKKTPGLKSLNLELTWRPFKFGSKVPTHSELAGAQSPPSFGAHSAESQLCQDEVERLIKGTDEMARNENQATPDALQTEDDRNLITFPKFKDDELLAVSRVDMRAAAVYPKPPNTYDDATKNPSDTSEELSNLQLLTPENEHRGDLIDTIHEDEEDGVIRDWKRRRLLIDDLQAISKTSDWAATKQDLGGYPAVSYGTTVDPGDRMLLDVQELQRYDDEFTPLEFSLPPNFEIAFADPHPTGTFPRPAISEGADQGAINASDLPQSGAGELLCNSANADVAPSYLVTGDIDDNRQVVTTLDHPALTSYPVLDVSTGDHNADTDQPSTKTSIQRLSSRLPKAPHQSRLEYEKPSLSAFLLLRGKKVTASAPSSSPSRHAAHPSSNDDATGENQPVSEPLIRSAPPDLLTQTRALVLPNVWPQPTTEFTFLASLELIQKRGLLRVLESDMCSVRLVERDYLTLTSVQVASSFTESTEITQVNKEPPVEVSIITSPYSAVIFFPLAALPSQMKYQSLLSSLATHSWSFSRIMLVLEAFPRFQLFRSAEEVRDAPYAYSPPVLTAANRIRRHLSLREGLGEKNVDCKLELAFADSVGEEAKLIRTFADLDLRDSKVDYAPYLSEEEQEGEGDLTELVGMNAFCAAVILRCCSLGEFIEMLPEQRVTNFGEVVGRQRIERVNAVLLSRLQAMDLPSSSDFLSSISG